MTESRFRERRSAFRDESVSETDAPTAPTSAGPAPTAAEPEPVEADRSAPPAQTEIPPPPAESSAEQAPRVEGEATGPDLEALAGMQIPEPSFLELVERHVEDALRFLGQLPLTPEGDRRFLPELARHEIDLLGILEQRTRGNLSLEEKNYMEQALDQLRTLYLRVSR